MSATLVTTTHPAGTTASLSAGILAAGWHSISRYFAHRSAIASLRQLDDRALQDIGLERWQIEAAVRGVISLRRASA